MVAFRSMNSKAHRTLRILLCSAINASIIGFDISNPALSAVCIDYLDGTRCHSYPEPTPSAPGTTQGMRSGPSSQSVSIGGRVKITAGPFKPGEEISVFVFGMFPQRYGQRLMYTLRAKSDGYVTAGYRPSRAAESYTYRNPYLCVRGEASGRLACVPFFVTESINHSSGSPSRSNEALQAYPQRPSPAPQPGGFSPPIPF